MATDVARLQSQARLIRCQADGAGLWTLSLSGKGLADFFLFFLREREHIGRILKAALIEGEIDRATATRAAGVNPATGTKLIRRIFFTEGQTLYSMASEPLDAVPRPVVLECRKVQGGETPGHGILSNSFSVQESVRPASFSRTALRKSGAMGSAPCSHSRRMYVRMAASGSSPKAPSGGMSSW